MANYLRAAGHSSPPYSRGLDCCACLPKTLAGYRGVMLAGLGEPAIAPGTPALLPVSDRNAVANAIRMFQHTQPVAGLGTTAQVSGAASGAATGAKVGSIVPGIGTVIGAVVGAVVGWLATKKKPVRATAQQVAACRSSLSEYMSYARQMPSQPIPLERDQLIDLNWCVQSIYGADIGLRDPRWFNPGFTDGLIPMARQIVRKIYETPIGKSVDLPTFSFRDPKGRTLTFKGFSFINPQFTDLKSFTDRYFYGAALEFCRNTAGKGAGGCEKLYDHEEWRRLLYDLIAWAAREELPNISEADLQAASAVAAQTGTAAKDVVAAVEQIIGRNVERGETAALITPRTAPPPSTAPPSVDVPPVTAPDLPQNATAADVQSAIQQLTAQLLQTQQAQSMTQQQAIAASTAAAQRWLSSQNIKAPPGTVEESARAAVVQAGAGGSSTPLLLGAAALLFALAYPRRARTPRAKQVTS